MNSITSPPLRTLVRLRFWAMAMLAVTVALVRFALGATLPVLPLLAVFAVGIATNVAVSKLTRHDPQSVVGAAAVLDTVLLTVFLALTGGPANPLSILYLVVVTLAATMTRPAHAWLVTALSSSGYAITFFYSLPLPDELGGHHAMHHGAYSAHVQGMWLAHTFTAIIITAFVSRLSRNLRQEREDRNRAARLLGLATLAAGAAHEIGNPLGTIRIAASELLRDLEHAKAPSEQIEDLRLIDSEVGRAQQVLERLAIGAGELLGETPVPIEVADFVRRATDSLGGSAHRVAADVPSSLPRVRWPVHATAQALTQLLKNAVDASPPDASVRCAVSTEGAAILLRIQDTGSGMSRTVLDRLGEPFFTTRPGQGMGLGVFIARSLIEHLGGRLQVESTQGVGTDVQIWLPLETPR
jgi:two-component system, sensor histidine kinase RegB